VGRLYRFRWQIELCFKEWKSYANLHQFDTANAHIAEGLIWASRCAAVLNASSPTRHSASEGRRCRRVASRCARITSSTPSSPRYSSASVFARPSVGASHIYSPTHDALTRIAIVALAAYAPGWASLRPLK
jgi:hypothetical protein